MCVEVVEDVIGEVDTRDCRVFLRHWSDKDRWAVEVLVLQRESVGVLGISEEHWLHNGLSGLVMVVERWNT